MKTKQTIKPWNTVLKSIFGIHLLMILTSGCSDAPSNPSETATVPQGELIQGAPIESEIASTDNTNPKPKDPSEEGSVLTVEQPNEETNTEQTLASEIGPLKTVTVQGNTAKIVKEENSLPMQEDLATSLPSDQGNLPDSQASVSAEPEPQVEGEFVSVSFEKLASFEYQMPEDLMEPVADEEGKPYKEQIPETIKSLNDTDISLKGFMLPLKVEKGLVTEMLIMRDQSMCCYGTVPKINEWVSVRMKTEGVKPIMDEAVTVYGTLKVGEVLENGYLVGIYEMDGKDMTVAIAP